MPKFKPQHKQKNAWLTEITTNNIKTMEFNKNLHSEKLGLKSYTIVITLFLFLFAIENVSSQNTVKHILTNDQKSTIEAISSLGMIDDQIGMAGNPIIQLDLNGNGQLDYVTAAHTSGLVFVFFDLPDFVNTTYSPSNGPNLIINGALGLGSSFASGDINGDGIDDLLLGAKNQGGDGEAYVIYGNSSFPTTGTVSIQVIKNIKITCSSDGGNSDLFGDQVATLDLNGDNYDDLLIGATHAWYEGDGSGPGDVYVIFGGPAVNNTIQARTQSNVIISGGNQFDHIGKYVGKGNFNNDGYEDLVFSSAYWPGAGASGQRGKVWILFGSANASGNYNTNNTYSNISTFEGPFQGDEMCYFEHGDINGDGVDDLLMAAGKYPDQYNTGIVYIAYGPISSGNTYNPATYPNKTIIKPTINSNWTDAKFGQSIAVSDVNNDGYDDMLIGGPGFSRPPLYYGTMPTEGAAWLIYGSASLGNIVNPDTEAVITFYGDNQNQIVNPDYSISFGRSVNLINSNNGKHYAAICDVERNKIRLYECPDYSSYRFEANCNSMQTFTTAQTDPPTVVISDFNGDGKKDIIACGNQGGIYKSYLYTNNGIGGFTESVFSFINFRLFDIMAVDYDNDLDNDLFITGITSQGVYVSKILKNNGNLNFTDANFSLEGLGNSSIDSADFNNDGYRDLVLTGKSNAAVLVTRIYINNLGSGFSLLTTTIKGTEYGEVKCGDFTGDGRADIFICGATSSSKISELYINNSNNTFSLNNGIISTNGGATTSLRAMSNASAAWGDLDLDGDLDLLVSGYGRNPFREYTKFYRNTGNGNFTDVYYDSYANEKISGPILTDVKYGSVAIVDINNDNAPDVLLVGDAGYATFSKLQNTCIHLNNGNGKFSQNFINDFEQVQNGYIGAADFDNDGDKEIVVIGQSASGPISRIYINKIINGVNCFNINQSLNIAQGQFGGKVAVLQGTTGITTWFNTNSQACDGAGTGNLSSGNTSAYTTYLGDKFYMGANTLTFGFPASNDGSFLQWRYYVVGGAAPSFGTALTLPFSSSGVCSSVSNKKYEYVPNTGANSVHCTATGSYRLDVNLVAYQNGNNYTVYTSGNYIPVTVNALGNPTSCTASISGTTASLGWTKFTGGSTAYNVMIVRYPKDGTPTAPTNGTAYALNSAIGSGTVIYATGVGSSTTNTVTASINYDYYFYSENWSYYSSGQKVTALAPAPTITLGANPSVCKGITTANLSYTATTNSPNQYSIVYDSTAISAGFSSVTNATLATSPIVLSVPSGATSGTYNGVLTVRNSTSGAVSSNNTFTVTIISLPNTGTLSGLQSFCLNGTSALTTNGTTGGTWSSSNSAIASVNSSGLVTGAGVGVATITYSLNGSGCSNSSTLGVTINGNTSSSQTVSACDSYTSSVNGQTYTSSGTYTYVSGCDTKTLNLTITPSTSSSTTASACGSYTWSVNGQTYTTSGTYTSVTGCDTKTLNLTIIPITSSTTTTSACDSYTWSVNGQTYTSSGTYTTVSGCDTKTLVLTIYASTPSSQTVNACDTYTWSVNGQTYTTSGTYVFEGTNAAGCSQNITLNLTINSSTASSHSVSVSVSVCDTYTWSVNGQTYTASGTYTFVGTNAAGCPDTKTLVLTINNSTSSSQTVSACDTYTWSVNEQTYTSSGTYTSTSTNAAGCPDTKTLVLTINPCESIVNLKLNIQGYYDTDTNSMRPVIANQGVGSSTTDVDDVTVELRDSITSALVASVTARLHTDGTATATFGTAPSGSFYIAVKHRNAIQTWSATAQTVGSKPLTYDFTTAANKAYGDNMIQLESGVYGFYSGDLNQDEAVDIFDFPLLLNDNDNFSSGYLSTDLNGDGAVDIFDFPLLLNNNDNFIYSSHP